MDIKEFTIKIEKVTNKKMASLASKLKPVLYIIKNQCQNQCELLDLLLKRSENG